MSSNTDDNDAHSIKRERYLNGSKRRYRSAIVRDPNGSASSFRRFYQSGGRDYEGYRLWLQTQSKIDQLGTPAATKESVKMHSRDTNVDGVLTRSLSVHSQPPISIPRASTTHSPLKSMRHVLFPVKNQPTTSVPTLPSMLLPPAFLESLNHVPYDYFPGSVVPILASNSSSSSPSVHWTVTDVGRFIAKHFPEKNLARKFIQQKIDGRTLPLLTEDHLMRIFKMKLGPALYLLSLISDSETPKEPITDHMSCLC